MFILILLLFSILVNAEEIIPSKPLTQQWSFKGILGSFDKQSIFRGMHVYRQVCASCHSLKRVSFMDLASLRIPDVIIKNIASSYQVVDGPNDNGEIYERQGVPSDYFVSPYPNKEAAALANNGAIPPDLSLITKARESGPDYIFSLLTGYTSEAQNVDGLYDNPYFSSGSLAMAPPLKEFIIEYDDATDATVDNMARDVVNFLQWAAEPEMEHRKSLGLKVIIFLVLMTVLLYFSRKRVWRDIEK